MTKLLRIDDVAEMTGISANTLRYWRHQSNAEKPIGPRSAKFGRRLVYRLEDVEAWIDKQFEDAK